MTVNTFYVQRCLDVYLPSLHRNRQIVNSEILPDDTPVNSQRSKINSNGALRQLAKSLAIRLASDSEFATSVQEELLKEWGGDYQFLFKNVSSKRFSSRTFSENLMASGLRSIDIEEINNNPIVRLLATESTITDKWNPSNTIVVMEVDNEDPSVRGFDGNGQSIKVSAETEPNVPVLVIGFCETCDENGNLKDEYLRRKENKARARVSGQEEEIYYLRTPPSGGTGGCSL